MHSAPIRNACLSVWNVLIVQGDLGPKLNPEETAEYWFEQPGAPYPKLENEDEDPKTVAYDELIKSWE